MEEILTPQYRIEDYLVAISNGESCPHTPIYRHEQYLAYLCGADVSVPQPIYRTEQYLAYKCTEAIATRKQSNIRSRKCSVIH